MYRRRTVIPTCVDLMCPVSQEALGGVAKYALNSFGQLLFFLLCVVCGYTVSCCFLCHQRKEATGPDNLIKSYVVFECYTYRKAKLS